MTRKRVRIGVLVFSIAFLNTMFLNMGGVPVPQKIYLAPDGDDSRGDGSIQRPFLTLVKANKVAEKSLKINPATEIHVLIKGGTYYQQQVQWTAIPKGGKLFIRGYGDYIPTFDGRENENARTSTADRLLTIKPTFGGDTNISVSYLKVQNYREGISLEASSRDDEAKAISNNRIEHIVFKNIGDEFSTVLDKSGKKLLGMAVIRLLNVHNSFMIDNEFNNINNTIGGAALHAYYLAHFSSNNLIEGNKFIDNMSGHPVKFRDFSNNNTVRASYFRNVSPTALQVWHCEKMDRKDCTKKGLGESRSYNNRETENIYVNAPKVQVYYEKNGLSNPRSYPDGFYGIIQDPKVYSGYLVRSSLNGTFKYGICPRSSDCISSSGICSKTGTTTKNHVCDNTAWLRRDIPQIPIKPTEPPVMPSVKVVDFQCGVQGDNSGCSGVISCPVGYKIKAVQAACNLEEKRITASFLKSLKFGILSVERPSDIVFEGKCSLNNFTLSSGSRPVSFSGVSSIKYSCSERDKKTGGDCLIAGTLQCEK